MVVAFAHPADAGAAAESGGAGSARTAARFVLKGAAALPAAVATPPQRQHSAQAVAQARAENGGAASGIADGSPVRPMMNLELRDDVKTPSPERTTPMRARVVNLGDEGDTPRRVRLITPRPDHQLFGRIYFDEKYQRDVRESENAENFLAGGTAFSHGGSASAEASPEHACATRPVASRPPTPIRICVGSAQQPEEEEEEEDERDSEADEREPAAADAPRPAPDAAQAAVAAATPERSQQPAARDSPPREPGPSLANCGAAACNIGDDVRVYYPRDGKWYDGTLRARRTRDGAYGVLFGKTAEWEAWAEWLPAAEAEARMVLIPSPRMRTASAPPKMRYKGPQYGAEKEPQAQAKASPPRAKPSSKAKVSPKVSHKAKSSPNRAHARRGKSPKGSPARKRKATSFAEPEESAAAGGGQEEAKPGIVAAIVAMGFDAESGQRAALLTGNQSIEAAANYLLGGRRSRGASKAMRLA